MCMCACARTPVPGGKVYIFKTKRSLCFNKLRTTSVTATFYRACFTKLNEFFFLKLMAKQCLKHTHYSRSILITLWVTNSIMLLCTHYGFAQKICLRIYASLGVSLHSSVTEQKMCNFMSLCRVDAYSMPGIAPNNTCHSPQRCGSWWCSYLTEGKLKQWWGQMDTEIHLGSDRLGGESSLVLLSPVISTAALEGKDKKIPELARGWLSISNHSASSSDQPASTSPFTSNHIHTYRSTLIPAVGTETRALWEAACFTLWSYIFSWVPALPNSKCGRMQTPGYDERWPALHVWLLQGTRSHLLKVHVGEVSLLRVGLLTLCMLLL